MEVKLIKDNLQIQNYTFNIFDIEVITLNKHINVCLSDGKKVKISSNNLQETFKSIAKNFYDAGLETFVTLKGNRIVNVKEIYKILCGSDGIAVITNHHTTYMPDLTKNDAKYLAEMYWYAPDPYMYEK